MVRKRNFPPLAKKPHINKGMLITVLLSHKGTENRYRIIMATPVTPPITNSTLSKKDKEATEIKKLPTIIKI